MARIWKFILLFHFNIKNTCLSYSFYQHFTTSFSVRKMSVCVCVCLSVCNYVWFSQVEMLICLLCRYQNSQGQGLEKWEATRYICWSLSKIIWEGSGTLTRQTTQENISPMYNKDTFGACWAPSHIRKTNKNSSLVGCSLRVACPFWLPVRRAGE